MYFEFQLERRQVWEPMVDVCERPTEIVLFVEMPGIERSDVKLSWHDGVLTIAGVKRQSHDPCPTRYHCLERNYGQFRRDIAINIPVAPDQARAELRDGLMRIYLPKRLTNSGPSEIPIQD